MTSSSEAKDAEFSELELEKVTSRLDPMFSTY